MYAERMKSYNEVLIVFFLAQEWTSNQMVECIIEMEEKEWLYSTQNAVLVIPTKWSTDDWEHFNVHQLRNQEG